MRLKTFYADTMTEAMQLIRESLGDEAIIVATGEDRGRGGVRVTAAIEPAFEIGDDSASAEVGGWLQYDEENDADAVAEELTEVLLRHCVPENVMDHIISCATVMGYDDIGIALASTLEELFSFAPLPTTSYNKPIMMVGPPGAGKTLAAAKMVARGAMNGLNMGVISTDTMRAGGVAQLQAFTNVLKVDLHRAETPQDLRKRVNILSNQSDQVIIDTSGLNPFNTEDIRILAKQISAVDCRPVLVLPAGLDCEESGEIARVFATLGVRDILPTRIDIARRLGSLLTAAHYGDFNLCDFSDTPRVAGGLSPLSPRSIAQLFIPRLYQSQKSAILHDAGTVSKAQKTGTR